MASEIPPNDDAQFSDENGNLQSLIGRNKDLILKLLNKRLSDEDAVKQSISKTDLLSHIDELLQSGTIRPNDIAAIVDELQGWGHQQVFLYEAKFNDGDLERWLNPSYVETRFKEAGLLDIFNCARPLTHTKELNLFESRFSEQDGRMRFKWAEVVGTLARKAEDDIKKPFVLNDDATRYERMVYHAYLESYAKDVSTFEWDIPDKNAVFLIRKKTNRSYKDVRDGMISDLAKLLPIKPERNKFAPVELRTLLRNLDDIEEVNKRRLRFESTHNKGKITLSSGDIHDIFNDNTLRQAYESFVADADRLGGSVSWPVEGRRPLGVYIQARDKDDQRIGITAQALEEEIRSVLRDIKRYST